MKRKRIRKWQAVLNIEGRCSCHTVYAVDRDHAMQQAQALASDIPHGAAQVIEVNVLK